MTPHATTGTMDVPVASSKLSEASVAPALSLITENPFGSAVDPALIKSGAYTSPNTVISQTVYAVASKIFSYETPGDANLLDAHLHLWAKTYLRQNSFGVVPFFHRFQVRSGASNALLGYYSKNGTFGQPLACVLSSGGLNYMRPTLAAKSADLPLSLNVSAIDYDFNTNSLVSNYSQALSAARALNFPVVTPISVNDGEELQYLTVVNHVLASWTRNPSVNLFDGPEFAKTYSKFDKLKTVAELGSLYEDLLKECSTTPASIEKSVEQAFANLNKLTGVSYAPFEYLGHSAATTVFVVYGSFVSTQFYSALEALSQTSRVGLIRVRLPLPFNQKAFVDAIPASARSLVVVSAESYSLKADITATLFLAGIYHNLSIEEFTYGLDFTWTPITVSKVLAQYVEFDPALTLGAAPSAPVTVNANACPEGKYLIWGKDHSDFLEISKKLALALSLDNTKYVSIRNKFDTVHGGGSFQSQLVSASTRQKSCVPVDSADIVLVEDKDLIANFDILATVKPGATVLLGNHKKINNSLEEDFVLKLPLEFRQGLVKNHNKLVVIDFSIVEDLDKANDSTKGFSGSFLVQLGFWRSAFPELGQFIVNKLLQANGNDFELLAVVLDKFIATVDELKGLRPVEIEKFAEEQVDEKIEEKIADAQKEKEEKEEKKEEKEEKMEEEEEPYVPPFFPTETSFAPNPRNEPLPEETNHKGYVDLATKLTFPEAYGVKKALRPDLPVKNFVVKVQENKRLTPAEYLRNIFHIEFDLTGTGLTYEIGEALGIHGRNTDVAVDEFLNFYGVDGDSLVEISNKDDASILEIRSARQALTETVDFLGKPPKRFYEALSPHATDEKEKETLARLASAAGAEELKKRQDVDFFTYMDLLDEFKSARPPFAELVNMIAPLKRREYSIASSQKLHPNALHLLIVVVDWVDTKGRPRFGHCSKYLSDLRIGQELVVSVKPSVMKLPPRPEQPIVMSGLGTGLAPFKAFIEEKIWQREQGMTIGEIYLYMGSRHKKEEYLYGELWEAYMDAGILTHIGAAFSRDQPEKIYIQDKIRATIEDLTDAIVAKEGSFYLCGPTWPVPDITACLEDIVINGAKKEGKEISDIGKVIEDMKEEGRYILEVY